MIECIHRAVKKSRQFLFIAFFIFCYVACNSGSSSSSSSGHSVSLTVSGLNGTLTATLFDGNLQAGSLTFTADGPQTFSGRLAVDGEYTVVLTETPDDQSCAIQNSFGTVSGNISLTALCTATASARTVSGVITGLAASDTATLILNSGDTIETDAGSFTFDDRLPDGFSYAVTVYRDGGGRKCTVQNGTGTIAANVTNVMVSCENISLIYNHETAYNGNLGGRSGADAKCEARASDARVSFNCDETKAFVNFSNSDVVADLPTNTEMRNDLPVYGYNSASYKASYLIGVDWNDATDGSWLSGGPDNESPGYTQAWIGANSDGSFNTDRNCLSFTTAQAGFSGSTIHGEGGFHAANWTCSSNLTLLCACLTEGYQLGGEVTGLDGSVELTVTYGGGSTEELTLVGNGTFYFSQQFENGESFALDITDQPDDQTCSLNAPSGIISASSNEAITLTCENSAQTTLFLFPSDSTVAANFGATGGARAAADDECQETQEASYSSLNCSNGVIAFLSASSTDAIEDFPDNYEIDTALEIQDASQSNLKIADNWADLVDGSIDNALEVDWWSGSSHDGSGAYGTGFTCSDFTVADGNIVTIGMMNDTTATWMGVSAGLCSQSYNLMCLCY